MGEPGLMARNGKCCSRAKLEKQTGEIFSIGTWLRREMRKAKALGNMMKSGDS